LNVLQWQFLPQRIFKISVNAHANLPDQSFRE
jgi:hypothetical protein